MQPVIFSEPQKRFCRAVARAFLNRIKIVVEQKVREDERLDRHPSPVGDALQRLQGNGLFTRFNTRIDGLADA
ncbi:MAG: hypothetical protein ABL957_14330 [Parvularculaceae bacterium]